MRSFSYILFIAIVTFGIMSKVHSKINVYLKQYIANYQLKISVFKPENTSHDFNSVNLQNNTELDENNRENPPEDEDWNSVHLLSYDGDDINILRARALIAMSNDKKYRIKKISLFPENISNVSENTEPIINSLSNIVESSYYSLLNLSGNYNLVGRIDIIDDKNILRKCEIHNGKIIISNNDISLIHKISIDSFDVNCKAFIESVQVENAKIYF